MIQSILLGAVAGARAMTPLALMAREAGRGTLPEDDRLVRLLGSPLARAGAYAMAAGELAGDKMKSAPDRIVVLGLLGRIGSAGVVGAALVPARQRPAAALAAAATAIGAAYLTFNLRMRAVRRFGQTRSGLVEDAIVIASALAINRHLPRALSDTGPRAEA